MLQRHDSSYDLWSLLNLTTLFPVHLQHQQTIKNGFEPVCVRVLFVRPRQKSTHEWLYDAGDDLSDVVAQKNAADIKDHLQPLVEHYPDFR